MQIRSKITASIANKLKTFHEAVRVNGNITKLGDVTLEKSVSLEGWREIFYRRSPAIHKKQSEKRLSAREKILLKRAFLRSVMISTPLSSMMPDRPDMTRTVKIMSGPNYRTDRTHPFTECPSVRGCFDDRSVIQNYILASCSITVIGSGKGSCHARICH